MRDQTQHATGESEMRDVERWNGETWEWCGEVENAATGWGAEELNGKVVGDVTEEEADALDRANDRGQEEVTVNGQRLRLQERA